jgi:hypothetical protein
VQLLSSPTTLEIALLLARAAASLSETFKALSKTLPTRVRYGNWGVLL